MTDHLTSPSLARVARGDLCAGCGACVGLLPEKLQMKMVEPGYLRPVQQAAVSAEEDALIARICPGLGQEVVAWSLVIRSAKLPPSINFIAKKCRPSDSPTS